MRKSVRGAPAIPKSLVVYDPAIQAMSTLLKSFWEAHDPTQGMRQGNDMGTQYRSAVYLDDPVQRDTAIASMADYENALRPATARSRPNCRAGPLYLAEAYHQQYLAKNPAAIAVLAAPASSARSAPAWPPDTQSCVAREPKRCGNGRHESPLIFVVGHGPGGRRPLAPKPLRSAAPNSICM